MNSAAPGTAHTAADPNGAPLLDVAGLSVEFLSDGSWLRVVEDVSFYVRRGEILGIVGESGSGKTVTSLAVMGLVEAPGGKLTADHIRFDSGDLLQMGQAELSDIRGRDLAMIFQEPARSLNPAFTVGDQIAETVRRHSGASRRDAWSRAIDMLQLVGIRSPEQRARDYPHLFSGGMCQRVMIAMALACEPKLLIADEPTTALDVTIQRQILDLMLDLRDRTNIGILLITHDLGVVAHMCDRVAVMYSGEIVETATADDLFERPQHPYTEGLLGALPDPRNTTGRFGTIPGRVPRPGSWPPGCRFSQRCTYSVAGRCDVGSLTIRPAESAPSSETRCVRNGELTLRGVDDG